MLSNYRFAVAAGLLCAVLSTALDAQGDVIGYWTLDSSSTVAGQSLTPNEVVGGVAGVLNNSVTIVNDSTRGYVAEFNDSNWIDAGFIPALNATTSDFTWTFWARQSTSQAINNDVILGNRYIGTASSQWIKFTPNRFEYPGSGVDYANIPSDDAWNHYAVVKSGNQLTYYLNGVASGTATVSTNTVALPFYMGGDPVSERWVGRMDDVAIFNQALTATEVAAAMSGNFASLLPARQLTKLSDDFSGSTVDSTKWQVINKGLQSTADGGYNTPSTTGEVLTIDGTTTFSYWAGKTLQSVDTFDASLQTTFSVDRLSLAGSGTAYRSSIWIWADDGHYLHFSQNVGENGWQYNWNDVGGLGSAAAVGGGIDLGLSSFFDGDLGLYNMKLVYNPSGTAGEATIDMYLDNVLVGSQQFTNWTGDFYVMMTGQARASGDTVSAVFDNALVTVVPEPSTLAMLLGLGLLGSFSYFRRRRRGG